MAALWAVQQAVLARRARARRPIPIEGIEPHSVTGGVGIPAPSPASGPMAASQASAGGELSRRPGFAVPLRGSPDSPDGACGRIAIGAGDGASREVPT